MNILTTIGNTLDGIDFNPIKDILKGIIYDILWWFIGGVLCIIKAIEKLINYIGIDIVFDLLLNGQDKFDIKNIPVQFWYFTLIAFVMIIFIFICQYVNICITCEDLTFKERLIQTLKMSGYATLFIIIIPVIFIVFLFLSKLFFQACRSAVGSQDIGLADMLYDLGDPDNPALTKHNYQELMIRPKNLKKHNLTIKIIAIGVIGYAMIMLGLGMVSKGFELLFLFIIAPCVGARMPSDQGQSIKVWKEMVIAKMLSNIGAMVGYMLFTIFYHSLAAIMWNKNDFHHLEKWTLMMLLSIGGAIFILLVPQMLSEFIGEQVGVREGRNALMGTRHALGTIKTGLGLLGVTTLFSRKFGKINDSSIGSGGSFGQRGGVIGAIGRSGRLAGKAIKKTITNPKQTFKSATSFVGRNTLRVGAVAMSASAGLGIAGTAITSATITGGAIAGKAIFNKYKKNKEKYNDSSFEYLNEEDFIKAKKVNKKKIKNQEPLDVAKLENYIEHKNNYNKKFNEDKKIWENKEKEYLNRLEKTKNKDTKK